MTTAPFRLLAAVPARAATLTALTLTGALALAGAAMLPAADAQAQAANRNLVVVLPDEPQDLDPCNMDFSTIGRVVRQNIGETLTETDTVTGALKPKLATSWTKVDDKTWRFKLREGVTYTDGTPFNAATVVQGIERTMNKAMTCSTRTRFFATLALKGTAVDPYTVDVSADKPVPILPTQMGVVGLVSPNMPRDKFSSTPIGTGPYVLDHWKAGEEVVLNRNPNYWGARPEVEQAKFIWRNESSVRAAMVKIGEADFSPIIAPQEATDPAMDFSFLNSETTWLRIDMSRKPLDDIRVRRAMNYAIDRKALVGSILPKDVIPATQVVMPSIPGHNHEIDKKVWAYDPAKAKALLAEAKAAGVDVGKEILLVVRINYYPNGQEAMEAMAGMLKAVGFNIKVQMFEVNQWTSINRKPWAEDRGPSILQSMHDNNNGDAVFSAPTRYGCEALTSNVCDAELEKKLNVAATLSGEERVKAYREIFRIVYEEIVPDVNMFHMVGYSRVGPRILYKPSAQTNAEIQIAQFKFK